jgi:hypothetical protein
MDLENNQNKGIASKMNRAGIGNVQSLNSAVEECVQPRWRTGFPGPLALHSHCVG